LLKPIKSNIIVELIQKEKVTASGIVLAAADREEATRGVVLAVGPEVEEVKVGDVILPNWNAGRKSKYEDKEFYVLPESEVVAIFED